MKTSETAHHRRPNEGRPFQNLSTPPTLTLNESDFLVDKPQQKSLLLHYSLQFEGVIGQIWIALK